MAITISVGFVVDDAIVVIENIYRHVEHGQKPMPAALEGARQIGFTVVSMSTSLVAVFIPLLFMGGLIGRLFHEFAVTLSLAILVSGVISLTLTPMLCSRFLEVPGLLWKARPLLPGQRMGASTGSSRVYDRGLRWVLRHQPFMLAVTVITLAFTVFLYVEIPKGFFPSQDTGSAQRHHRRLPGYFLQGHVAGCRIKWRASCWPTTRWRRSAPSSAPPRQHTVNNGRMFITLKPRNERPGRVSADQIIARLRRKTADIPGADLILRPTRTSASAGACPRASTSTPCNPPAWTSSTAGRPCSSAN